MVVWKNDPDNDTERRRGEKAWESLMQQTHDIRKSIWGDEELPDRQDEQ